MKTIPLDNGVEVTISDESMEALTRLRFATVTGLYSQALVSLDRVQQKLDRAAHILREIEAQLASEGTDNDRK